MRRFLVAAVSVLAAVGALAAAPPAQALTPPAVYSLSAHDGSSRGGASVTMRGSFVDVRQVYFGTAAARFALLGGGGLRVTAPAHAPGWVNVTVVNAAGRSRLVPADRFRYVSVPHISSAAPRSVIAGTRSSVLLTGWSFLDVRSVRVGGAAAVAFHTGADGHRLRLTMPDVRPGSAAIVVTTAFGSTSTQITARLGSVYLYGADASTLGEITVSWSTTALPRFGRSVMVRMASGHTAPMSVSSGSLVADRQTGWQVTAHVAPGQTYSFSVFAEDGSGHYSAPSSVTALANPRSSVTWSSAAPGPVPETFAPPSVISCADMTWCMGASVSGKYVIDDTGRWSAPADLPVVLDALSCASSTFCAGVSTTGAVSTWDGSSWSTPQQVGQRSQGFVTISCWAPGSCLGTTSRSVLRLAGGTWTATPVPAAAASLNRLSCTSDTFCMAGGGGGSGVVVFSAGTWTTQQPYPDFVASSVVCTAARSCLAAGSIYGSSPGPAVATYAEGAWTDLTRLTGGMLDDIACAGPDRCIAATRTADRIATLNGSTWSVGPIPGSVANNVHEHVACAPGGVCLALDTQGYAATYGDSGWSPVAAAALGRGGQAQLSCAGTAFCVALDAYGSAYAWNGASWSASDRHLRFLAVQSMSCASADFCAAVGVRRADGAAQWSRWDGTTWSEPELLTMVPGLSSFGLSCVSATFCLLVGGTTSDSGFAVTYDGQTWKQTAAPNRGIVSVSCTSATFCMGSGADTETFTGSSWHVSRAKGAGAQVDCASATMCVSGNLVYDGAGWRSTAGDPATGQASCTSAHRCVALTGPGLAVQSFDGTTWAAKTTLDSRQGWPALSCVRGGACFALADSSELFRTTD